MYKMQKSDYVCEREAELQRCWSHNIFLNQVLDSQMFVLLLHFTTYILNVFVSEAKKWSALNGRANSLRTDVCLVSAWKTQTQLWEEMKMLFPRLTAQPEGAAYQVDLAKANRRSQRCEVGTSLAVQWLGLRASTAGGMGSIPGQGIKIPHATQHSQSEEKGCTVTKEEFFLGWKEYLKLSFHSFLKCCTIFEKDTTESLLLSAEACSQPDGLFQMCGHVCSHRPSRLPASKVGAPRYLSP